MTALVATTPWHCRFMWSRPVSGLTSCAG